MMFGALVCVAQIPGRRAEPPQHVHIKSQPWARRATPWVSPRQPAALRCRAAVQPASGSAGEKLAEWLTQWEHDDCGVKVQPEKDGNGFCAVAKQPIKKGSTLVRIPREAIILPNDVRDAPVLSAAASWAEEHQPPDGLSDWQLLCLWLIWHEHLGPESAWAPYLAVVPQQAQMAAALSHPLIWPEAVAESLLAGSSLLGRLKGRMETCREDLAAIRAAAEGAIADAETSPEDRAALGPLLPKLTEGAVRWAASLVLSRAFYFDETEDWDDEKEEGDWGDDAVASADFGTVALVPWADSLNHSSEAGVESCLGYDPETREASLDAHRDYKTGEQVFDSYGPERDPSILFLDYGFAEDPIPEPRADLPAAMLGEPAGEANRALLCAVGLSPEGATATFGADGPGDAVMAWARAASASKEELAQAGWPPPAPLGKKGKKAAAAEPTKAYVAMGRFSEKISDANEREAIRRLLAACEAQIAILDKMREQRAAPAFAAALKKTGSTGQAALRVIEAEAAALRGSIEYLKESRAELAPPPPATAQQ